MRQHAAACSSIELWVYEQRSLVRVMDDGAAMGGCVVIGSLNSAKNKPTGRDAQTAAGRMYSKDTKITKN